VSADSQQDALPVKNPLLVTDAALQNDSKQMTENNSKRGVDILSSANANVRAYQAQLLEMAQTNMQFAFEFAQRLAMIKAPLEFPGVIAEFTNKRIALFRKYSKEWLIWAPGCPSRDGSAVYCRGSDDTHTSTA
jgi:hypothetical protein